MKEQTVQWSRGTVGTQEERNTRYRGTVGKEEHWEQWLQRNNGYRGAGEHLSQR